MGSLLEYAKLLPKGLANPKGVVLGWINAAKLQNNKLEEDEVEEILKRRLICQECPLMSENAKTSQEYLDIFGKHYKSDRKEEHCSICSCPLVSKTASLTENCGIKADKKTKNLDYRWTIFIKDNK